MLRTTAPDCWSAGIGSSGKWRGLLVATENCTPLWLVSTVIQNSPTCGHRKFPTPG